MAVTGARHLKLSSGVRCAKRLDGEQGGDSGQRLDRSRYLRGGEGMELLAA